MVSRTLGVFIDKSSVESTPAFFLDAWNVFANGPEIVRPRRVGNWEPLKKVEEVDAEKILASSYIISNGRKCFGMISDPGFREHRFFNVTLHITLAKRDDHCADEIYDWLLRCFNFSIAYMGTPSEELFRSNLELHQMLNCGLVETKLEKALSYRHLLDRCDVVSDN